MLLSLLGLVPVGRNDILSLFNLKRSNPDYPGSTHFEMGRVFARASSASDWRWESQKRFDFASVTRTLSAQLQSNGCPTLLSFGIVHRNGVWRCKHVAVVLGSFDDQIELLDPLGAKPPSLDSPNVWLCLSVGARAIEVIGNSYTVDQRIPAAVFRWKVK